MQVCTAVSGTPEMPNVPVGNVGSPATVVEKGDASVGVFAIVGVLLGEL